jgi:hypothetical protein
MLTRSIGFIVVRPIVWIRIVKEIQTKEGTRIAVVVMAVMMGAVVAVAMAVVGTVAVGAVVVRAMAVECPARPTTLGKTTPGAAW